jgi:hypothetical protein
MVLGSLFLRIGPSLISSTEAAEFAVHLSHVFSSVLLGGIAGVQVVVMYMQTDYTCAIRFG